MLYVGRAYSYRPQGSCELENRHHCCARQTETKIRGLSE